MAARQQELDLRNSRWSSNRDLSTAPQANFHTAEFAADALNPFDQRQWQVRVDNPGQQKLKLEVGAVSSDAIEAKLVDAEIRPGGTGLVELKYVAPNASGPVEEAVYLRTNDPRQEVIALQVTGDVRRTVWTEVPEMAFGELKPTETQSKQFRVFSAWDEGFSIEGPEILPAGVIWTDETLPSGDSLPAGAKTARLVTLTCDRRFKGNLAVDLQFKVLPVGSAPLPVPKRVRISGRRMALMSMSHDRLNVLGTIELGNIGYGSERVERIALEARGDAKAIQLSQVKCDPAFLQVELQLGVNAAESGLYWLQLRIPNTAPLGSYTGVKRGSITLHFDNAEYPPVTFHPEFIIRQD